MNGFKDINFTSAIIELLRIRSTFTELNSICVKWLFNIVILLFMFGHYSMAQEKDTTDFMMGYVKDSDTIIHKNIKEVWVMPKTFKNKRLERRYWRYINKVKKVYPYAVKARELLIKYEPEYEKLEKQSDKRKLMKKLEKELLAEHKDELKRWSISDGRILLKLIHRETKHTPYKLIKDFRGDLSAFFWQGIARLFKNNLKGEYDPEGEDKVLEEVVILIELGYI